MCIFSISVLFWLPKPELCKKWEKRFYAILPLLFSPFFAHQKKGFSFFSCGATSSRTVPKTQPLQVAFSLRERVDLRSQKQGNLEKSLGKGGADRANKGKKDAQKEVGFACHQLISAAYRPSNCLVGISPPKKYSPAPPDLPFLAFLEFLAFFLPKPKEFLAFFCVFPFFPRILGVRQGQKNPCCFGGSPCRFQKKQGKEDQGPSPSRRPPSLGPPLVAHDCGCPLSRYTCRATRVAADFLDFIAFCRCSTGVVLHAPSPPPRAGRCRTEIWV